MTHKLLPYNSGSQSAKRLAEGLNGVRLKRVGRTYVGNPNDVLINWGLTRIPERFIGRTFLNSPEAVLLASNKLRFFEAIKAVAPEIIPQFWTRKEDVPNNKTVFCRTILNGHSGDGIVIARNPGELVDAPLYVEKKRKNNEYRIHVGRVEGRKNPDKIIAKQRKARLRSVPDHEVNWEIRNLANGFIFARQNVEVPARVADAARQALEIIGLDFGAVDVIDNERKQKSYVLEINSAPGLEGKTVDDYVRYFND